MRSVTHYNNIGSVAETASELYLGTRPLARFLAYSEMQSAARVRPCIFSIVRTIQASPISGNGANFPVVSAEMKRLRRVGGQGPNAFDNVHHSHRTTLGGR